MDDGDRRGVDRLTIQEAARRLGISEGAVRKRVARDSLEHDKDDDGRVYVYLAGGARELPLDFPIRTLTGDPSSTAVFGSSLAGLFGTAPSGL